jgi:hypothetical protein
MSGAKVVTIYLITNTKGLKNSINFASLNCKNNGLSNFQIKPFPDLYI